MEKAVGLVIVKHFSVRAPLGTKGFAFQTASRYLKNFKNDSPS